VVDIKVRFGAKLQNNHNEAKHFSEFKAWFWT